MKSHKIYLSTLLPLIVVSLIYSIVLVRYAKKFDRNITGFICIGDLFRTPANQNAIILKNSAGYDGQYFYTIAHDPFIKTEICVYPDNPPYRYGRIIYPLIAYLTSFGKPKAIPYALLLINILSLLGGTFFIIKILRHFETSSWYAIFYGFSAGFLLSILRTMCEPVATLFVVSGIYYFLKEKYFFSSLALCLAVLTRETTFLVVIAAGLTVVFKNKSVKQALLFMLPFLMYLLWQAYIHSLFHYLSFSGGTKNVGLPLVELVAKLKDLLYINTIKFSFNSKGPLYQYVLELTYLASIVLAALLLLKNIFKDIHLIHISSLFYVLLALSATHHVWIEPWSYMRTLNNLFVFLLLNFAITRNTILLIPLLGNLSAFILILYWLAII